jgi:hypothetical protein
MKKILGVLLILAVAAGGVFAEVNFSGNGSATFVPFGARFGDPVESAAGSEVRWGDGPRVQLSATGKNEAGNIGGAVQINADSTGLALDANAKAWIKLNDVFKVTFGKFQEDDLRYKIGLSGAGFNNYLLYIRGDALDENAFFSRFNSGGWGSHLTITPIENLYIGAALGSTTGKRSISSLREDGAIDVWKNIQVGAGYKIPDIGFVRFQFLGETPLDDTGVPYTDFKPISAEATGSSPTVQAAFQLTAVKGLNIDIGGQVPFGYTVDATGGENTIQRPYIAGLGFDYTIPSAPLRLYGRVSYKFGGQTEFSPTGGGASTTTADGNDLLFGLTPMYTVAPNWIVGLELTLDVQTGSDLSPFNDDNTGARGGDKDAQYIAYWAEATRAAERAALKNNYTDIGVGAFVRHNIANGDIRVGATVKLPGGEAHEGAKPQLFFPIIFNYNF